MKEQDYLPIKQPRWPKRNITLQIETISMKRMKRRCLEVTENTRENSVPEVTERKQSSGNLEQQCFLYGQRKLGCQGATKVKISFPLLAGWFGLNLRGGVWSDNVHVTSSCWRVSQANKGCDRYSLAFFQDEDQRANQMKGIYGYGESSHTPSGEPGCLITALKCLYTDTCSMKNKQELEI